ncbi:MAG: PLD nuclease N-terminal domain-containing protein [Alphaproteobacteria bacterium]|jgi:hypothetical protein|nr:PLD nuclease N-terminal domain-containing protein [Alphaproteobacteria bacterium]
MEYGIVGLLILALDIYGIVQVLNSSASGMAKVLWILAILVFPVIGLIVWYLAGPKPAATSI